MQIVYESMLIRRATPGDVRGMKDVLRDAFHDSYIGAGEFYSSSQLVDPNYATTSGSYYSLQSLLEDNLSSIEGRLKGPFNAFVAVERGEIVGYAITEIHKKKLWINDMVVRRDKQKRGIGRQLFDAATKGHGQIHIWVNSKNPSMEFWKKMGFGEVLEEKLMVKNRPKKSF
jgi:N-acetylglutamate synthase-like GNAT family acetyltransferase